MKKERVQTPYIELSKVNRFFGITKALEQIDFQIFSGEVIGLVGPNGAGKSTMMKILTGVLPPTDGKIIVDGTEMKRYTTKEAKEAGIACAYQDLSLCTNLSVYENFGVSLPHSSTADRNVGVDVGGLENAQPGDLVCYSGHVGIYIGDGQIVHASTASTGIKISDADYRTPVAVRRVIQ